MVSVRGNLYSVRDTTRRRVFNVHVLADEIRVFEDKALVAIRAPLEERNGSILCIASPSALAGAARANPTSDPDARRRSRRSSFARLLCRRRPPSRRSGRRPMSAPSLLERVKTSVVGLKMPRVLGVLDVTLRVIERGEIGAVEAIDALLTEELTLRENRRVKMAVQMARLSAIKTLAGSDFAFEQSLDRNRILALAGLQFTDRSEAVHLIEPES
jgi:IstB-like ATP binding protein